MPLFECPAEHRQKLEEVKAALHISHRYLDSWVYLFLHNKKYDVAETIAKLHRRDAMEKSVYAHYEMTPYLKQSMRGGIVQYIGRDKAGRPVLFFNTARDFPTTEQRPARQANLDMFLGWSVRCDQINPTSTVTWLINQKDASMMRNTDLIFQKDMALRISKFFPGVVAKMYLCNMSTALTFVLKPLVKQLPSGISECIHMFSGGDLRKGKLLEFIDAEVLPVSMGGTNDCDNQDNYNRFGDLVEGYFDRCMHALRQGISIKEMEMMEAYGVDQHGQKVVKEVASPSPLTEEVVKPAQHPIHVNVVDGASVLVTSTSHKNFADVRQLADSFSSGTAAVFHPHPGRSSSAVDGTDSFTALAPSVLPTPNMQLVEDFSFGGESLPLLRISTRESDELLRDWTRIRCFAVELIPCLRGILSDLRDHSLSSSSLRSLMEQKMRIRRMAHHLLNLSPQTNHRMAFPVFRWLNECLGDERSIDCAALDRLVLDCSSPDDVLISLQGAAVSYIDDCSKLMEMNKVQERILRSVLARWTMDQTREGLLATLRSEAQVFWEELRGYFRRYIDAKVAISLAEFIRHYDLLLPEGRIDMQATWYRSLSTELVHFREGHRRNWLFHVFPPLRYDDHGTEEEVELPLLPDMLRAANRDGSFDAVAAFLLQAEYSISATRDQFAARTVMTAHTREMVERFIEESEGKISIPYAEQQNGILPASMVEAQKDLARQHLDACEDPMRELLSRLAMMYVLGHPISEGEDRATAVRSIDRRRRLWSELTDARQDSRRLAVSYSQSAYDMQGSFGEDAENVLFITNYPPDGYALGLQMLLLVAFLQHRGRSTGEEASCFGGEMAMDGGGTPLSTRGEEAMQQRDAIATFLTSLTAMEPAASHMAAIKRRFIP